MEELESLANLVNETGCRGPPPPDEGVKLPSIVNSVTFITISTVTFVQLFFFLLAEEVFLMASLFSSFIRFVFCYLSRLQKEKKS